jgi:hypothetical protein
MSDVPEKRRRGRPEGRKDAYPRIRTKHLTSKEATFVRKVRELTPEGELPNNETLQQAALAAYDIMPRPGHSAESIAATIAGQKLKKPLIYEQLMGMKREEAQRYFQAIQWEWLLGMDEQHPRNIDLKMKAATLLARSYIPNEEHVTQDTNVYAGRSTEDIEYFAAHGHWPEQKETVTIDVQGPTALMPKGEA